MITLRLTSTAGAPRLDRPAVSVGTLTLIRHASHIYAQVDVSRISVLMRALAYVGIAAERCGQIAFPFGAAPPHCVRAVGLRLDPLPAHAYVFDVCRVRTVDLGAATGEALRRWLPAFRPPSARARELCRRILRGEEGVIAWERHVWLPGSALRDRRVRAVVRPVVFGNADTERMRGRSLVSAGELERWAS